MATTLKIENSLKARVKHLADLRHRSAHWIMLKAIQDYVEREEAKEAFKHEALTSWKEYKENQLHLTGEEVKSWLKTWGTDKETKIPPCHD